MLKMVSAALLAAAVSVSTPAAAQSWSPYGGYYPPRMGYGWGNPVRSVCSGQKAFSLENRLRHEEREGEIDPYAAARIHQTIDRLEDQQRHECAERDWRSIVHIARAYDRIGQWIDNAAHGYRGWDR